MELLSTVDLNLSSLKEYAKLLGYKNESSANRELKKLENLGLMKIFPRVDLNKRIDFDDILNSTTGYPLVDSLVHQLKLIEKNSTGEILSRTSKQIFDDLLILLSKFLEDSKTEEESKDFKQGLFKQINLICAFCYYKETSEKKMDFDEDTFTQMLKAIQLEAMRRQKNIKDYYFKLSNTSLNTVNE